MKIHANEILMIRPASFAFNNMTAKNNHFQTDLGLSSAEVQQKALFEFDHMVQQLTSAGIKVHVLPDSIHPLKPDAIFPNNWLVVGNKKITLFPMYSENRRLERTQSILDYVKKIRPTYEVNDLSDWEQKNHFLEGTGSMVFDHATKSCYACISERTDEELLKKYCKQIQYEPIVFGAIDESGRPIYHTNVMMSIGPDYIVVCSDSIENNSEKKWVQSRMELSGKRIIEINHKQMNDFCANILAVNAGSKIKIISSIRAYTAFSAVQKSILEKSGEIIPIDIDIIEKVGGGGVRCMICELY